MADDAAKLPTASYFEAWKANDSDTMRSLLAEQGVTFSRVPSPSLRAHRTT